jgi:hypothetical protein
MEITGVIKVLKDTQEVSDKFKKRELVVTTEETYPQDILIEFSQDKCALLDKYAEGQRVEVGINLRGRCWSDPKTGQDRYFNTIQGWRLQATDGQSATTPISSSSAATSTKLTPEELDTLPF